MWSKSHKGLSTRSLTEIRGLASGISQTHAIISRSVAKSRRHCRRFPETTYLLGLKIQYPRARLDREHEVRIFCQMLRNELSEMSQAVTCTAKTTMEQTAKCLQYLPISRVKMSRLMTKPTKCHVRPAKTQISLISLRCPHEEPLGPQLPIERTAKTLIRLGGCWAHSHCVCFVMRRLKFYPLSASLCCFLIWLSGDSSN